MAKTVRLTMAQALARFLASQMTEIDDARVPLVGGVWAIFGHGNVAGLGEALHGVRDRLPTRDHMRGNFAEGRERATLTVAGPLRASIDETPLCRLCGGRTRQGSVPWHTI